MAFIQKAIPITWAKLVENSFAKNSRIFLATTAKHIHKFPSTIFDCNKEVATKKNSKCNSQE